MFNVTYSLSQNSLDCTKHSGQYIAGFSTETGCLITVFSIAYRRALLWPLNSIQHLVTLRSVLVLSYHLCLYFANDHFSSRHPTKIVYTALISYVFSHSSLPGWTTEESRLDCRQGRRFCTYHQWVQGSLSPGIKRLRHEADYPHLYTVRVQEC